MTVLSVINSDRREYPRSTINSEIKYKPYGDTVYSPGMLLDLSETGALVEILHELPEDTLISLFMIADDTDEVPVEIIAEIIRQSEASSDDHYTYGCLILDIINH